MFRYAKILEGHIARVGPIDTTNDVTFDVEEWRARRPCSVGRLTAYQWLEVDFVGCNRRRTNDAKRRQRAGYDGPLGRNGRLRAVAAPPLRKRAALAPANFTFS